VLRIERVGKYLLLHLDDAQRLLLHLGMTGQLFASGSRSVRLLSRTARSALSPELQGCFQPDQHTHLRLEFADSGAQVFFRDVRKFGKVRLLKLSDKEPRLERLGVDALLASGGELFAACRKRKIAIKSVLLDQSVIAGIGNIYADEALYLAGIRPNTSAVRLQAKQCVELVTQAQVVLQRSIATGGSSIRDYVTPDGTDGGYQDERKVYGRQGEPCLRCRTAIERTVISARSTHFCPKCQR
jgi:formamidopyrimidine-DNA glycosylase